MALTTANNTQALSEAIRLIVLVDLEFPSGAIYVTDLDRPITVGGIVYSPSAVLQGIGGLADNVDGKPRRLSIAISGLDDATRARTLANRIAFGKARVRIGFCDSTWSLIDTPIELATAALSNAEANFDDANGNLEISMETSAILLQRDAKQLVSNESQLLRFAGDTAMSRVTSIGAKQISWGGSTGVNSPLTGARSNRVDRSNANVVSN